MVLSKQSSSSSTAGFRVSYGFLRLHPSSSPTSTVLSSASHFLTTAGSPEKEGGCVHTKSDAATKMHSLRLSRRLQDGAQYKGFLLKDTEASYRWAKVAEAGRTDGRLTNRNMRNRRRLRRHREECHCCSSASGSMWDITHIHTAPPRGLLCLLMKCSVTLVTCGI